NWLVLSMFDFDWRNTRPGRSQWFLIASTFFTAVILAACNSGSPSSGVTSTIGPTRSSGEATMLSNAALEPGDIGQFFSTKSEAFVSNEDLSSRAPDPGSKLQELQSEGRISGFERTVGPDGKHGFRELKSSVSEFQTAPGAAAFWS